LDSTRALALYEGQRCVIFVESGRPTVVGLVHGTHSFLLLRLGEVAQTDGTGNAVHRDPGRESDAGFFFVCRSCAQARRVVDFSIVTVLSREILHRDAL